MHFNTDRCLNPKDGVAVGGIVAGFQAQRQAGGCEGALRDHVGGLAPGISP